MKSRLLVMLFFSLVLSLIYAEIENFNNMDYSIINNYKYYGINHSNPLNRENHLSLPDWNYTTEISSSWTTGIPGIMNFTLGTRVSFFELSSNMEGADPIEAFQPGFQEFLHFYLEKAALSFLILEGQIVLELGKLLPEYGVGYINKPTNYIARATNSRSKYLIDLLYFHELFNFEFLYAPNRDFIPDDYTEFDTIITQSDFFLFKAATSFGPNVLNLFYFYEGSHNLGLSFSSQIGDQIIPYAELLLNNNNKIKYIDKIGDFQYDMITGDSHFFEVLAGISFTPLLEYWTLYFEYYYNGDAYAEDDWNSYFSHIGEIENLADEYNEFKTGQFGAFFNQQKINGQSQHSFYFHLKQNKSFFNVLSLHDTLVMKLPFSLLNFLDADFELGPDFTLGLSFSSILFAAAKSEYKVFPHNFNFKIKLEYNFYL